MPADYRIDRDKHRVLSTATGPVSYEDFAGHMRRLKADKDFDPSFSQLLDFTGATEVSLTHDQIYELAAHPVFSNDSRRAFVTGKKVQFGIARVFQSYREARGERGIRVFSDMREAVEWLDHGDPPVAQPGDDPAPSP
jgi:hypothetical protein